MNDNVSYMFGNPEDFEEVPADVVGVNDTVNIPRTRYEDLLDTEAWVQALEAAGVDNWDGFDYALEIYEEGNEQSIGG